MINQACPTCKREGYIKPLDDKGKFRCGYCGEELHKKPGPKKSTSKPKSTAKNKMETPNDPLDK